MNLFQSTEFELSSFVSASHTFLLSCPLFFHQNFREMAFLFSTGRYGTYTWLMLSLRLSCRTDGLKVGAGVASMPIF
jgi:hypothetical protein